MSKIYNICKLKTAAENKFNSRGFDLVKSMVHFISFMRRVDTWKSAKATRALAMYEAREEENIDFMKDPRSKSCFAMDLLNYLDASNAEMMFLVNLPSIQNALTRWWNSISNSLGSLDKTKAKSFFFDLASVLVEGKTVSLRKKSIGMLMTGQWSKWSIPSEFPITKKKFCEIVFILAHLMTDSSQLGDYVVFLNQTLEKFEAHQHQKPTSRIRLKREKCFCTTSDTAGVVSAEADSHFSMNFEDYKLSRTGDDFLVPTTITSKKIDLSERRNSSSQRVINDPQLNDLEFQRKWQKWDEKDVYMSLGKKSNRPLEISSLKWTMPPIEKYKVSNKENLTAVKKENTTAKENKKNIHQELMLRRNCFRPSILARIGRIQHNAQMKKSTP